MEQSSVAEIIELHPMQSTEQSSVGETTLLNQIMQSRLVSQIQYWQSMALRLVNQMEHHPVG